MKKVCKYLERGYICSKTREHCAYFFEEWDSCADKELVEYTVDQQKKDRQDYITDHTWHPFNTKYIPE